MRRRELLALLAAAGTVRAMPTFAQTTKPIVGFP